MSSLEQYRTSVTRPLGPDEVRGITISVLKDLLENDEPNTLSRSYASAGQQKTVSVIEEFCFTNSRLLFASLDTEEVVALKACYDFDSQSERYTLRPECLTDVVLKSPTLLSKLNNLERKKHIVALSSQSFGPSGSFRSIHAFCSRAPFSRDTPHISSLLDSIEQEVERGLTGASITIHGLLDADFLTELTTADENGLFPYPNTET